jgi:SAM-dependent methyltransferase
MEYHEAFYKREHKYEYAVTTYENVLKREFEIAIEVLDLKEFETLVNIPAGGIPIDSLKKIQYHAFEPLKGTCEFTAIPLEDNSVDKILSLASFHHVQEKRKETLIELRRILKQDGTLVIGDVIAGSKQDYWLNYFVNKYNSNGHNGLFLKEEEALEIEKIGFNVELKVYTYDWSFDNDENAVDFVKNLFGLDLLDEKGILLNAMKDILGYNDCKFEWQLMYFKCKKI